jgi:tetratricopeptide (TPR) repeat protein
MINLKIMGTFTAGVDSYLYCFLLMIFMVFNSSLKAQDKIYKSDSTVIAAKVAEISDDEIKYKKYSNLSGPTYIVKKADVMMIIYENGEKEIYNHQRANSLLLQQPKTSAFDSLAYIEQYFGVSFETTSEDEGGVMIKGTYGNVVSRFRGRGGLSPDSKIIKYIGANATWVWDINKNFVRIRNTSDLCRVIFDLKTQNVTTILFSNGGNVGITSFVCKADISNMNNNISSNMTYSSAITARNFIINGNINEGIATYSRLVPLDSTNVELRAEYAYALALGGLYDAALINLDRIWYQSNDINFYTSQIFLLMGYDDIANDYWTPSILIQKPSWITFVSKVFTDKYKRKFSKSTKLNSEEIVAKFKLANQLVGLHQYYRAIALFHEITDTLPNEFLPYAGYSVPLEKTGAVNKSVQVLEKAILIVGNKPENSEKKQFLEERLASVKAKIAEKPAATASEFQNPKAYSYDLQKYGLNATHPQMMAYFGGMVEPNLYSINFRIGYYVLDNANMSLNLGTQKDSLGTSFNMGLSIYGSSHSFIYGVGLLYSSHDSGSFSVQYSIGFRIKSKGKQYTTGDLFFVINEGFDSRTPTTFNISYGTSIYWGKRKQTTGK